MPVYATPLEYQGDSLVFSELDPDALAIITATETADGLELESTVRNAINDLVVGCKSDNIWTPLSSGVFRLMAGPRTLAGIFKCGFGSDPTNIGFVNGDYTRATGLKNNGGKRLDVTKPASVLQNSTHFSVYSTEMVYGSNGRYLQVGNVNSILANTQGCRMRASDTTLRSHGTGTPDSGLVGFSRSQSTNYDWAFSTQYGNQSSTSVADTIDLFTLYTAGANELLTRLSWFSSGMSLGVNGLSLLESRLSTYMSAITGI